MTTKSISTDEAPKAIGPYSQGIEHDGLLFLSGQIPLNPRTGNIETQDIESQTKQVMQNLESVLKAAGSDFTKVLKCTVFLSDLDDYAAFNKVYGTYFTSTPPARSTIQAMKLPRGARVEIDVIACKP